MTERQVKKKARELLNIFLKTERLIITSMLGGVSYTPSEQAAILASIEAKLKSSKLQTDKWVARTVPTVYKEGAKDIIKASDGVFTYIYSSSDRMAIDGLIKISQANIGESLNGMYRSSSRILSSATKERIQAKIIEGRVTGTHITKIKGMIAQQLKDGSITLIDRAGRKWSAERYADMYARTDIMHDYNQGMINQTLQNDHDLVRVTTSNNPCELCIPWENKVVSITGRAKGYPTLAQAESKGLFHPNCYHRVLPYFE
jgi:hypothetical protein